MDGLNLWDQWNVGKHNPYRTWSMWVWCRFLLDFIARRCSIFAGGQLGELCWIYTDPWYPKTAMQLLQTLNVSETLLFHHVVHRNLQRLRPMPDSYVALVMILQRIGLAEYWDKQTSHEWWVSLQYLKPNFCGVASKLRCNNLGYMAFLHIFALFDSMFHVRGLTAAGWTWDVPSRLPVNSDAFGILFWSCEHPGHWMGEKVGSYLMKV